MVPNINPRGHSFKGVTLYVMRDKGKTTSERVGNTSTHNLHTDDVFQASRFMAWTDMNRDFIRQENGSSNCGAKGTAGNVYHETISWRIGDDPSWEHMQETAMDLIKRQGLKDHQYYIVEHTDRAHKHLHIVASLVHPDTGIIKSVYNDHKVADRWANEYEQQHEIQCENRAKKYQDWQQQIEQKQEKLKAFPEKDRKEEYTQIATQSYQQSDSGKAFAAALESHGLTLAQGNRRGFVFVDERGEVYSLNRFVKFDDIEKGRAIGKRISARLKDLDASQLPVADELANERKYYDRDAQEVDQQNALLDAAEEAASNPVQAEKESVQQEPESPRKRPQHVQSEAGKRAAVERARQRREAVLEREIHEKTEESRARWQVDEFTKKRDKAYEELKNLSGWWSRNVLKRSAYLEAQDHYQNAESQLRERSIRLREDVIALNKERSAFKLQQALEKQGVENEIETPSRSYEERLKESLAAYDARLAQEKQEQEFEENDQQSKVNELIKKAQELPVEESPEISDYKKREAEFLERMQSEREAEQENGHYWGMDEPASDNLSPEQDFLNRMQRQREQDRDQGMER